MQMEHINRIIGQSRQNAAAISLPTESIEHYQPHFGTAVTGIEIHHSAIPTISPAPFSTIILTWRST